MSSQSKVQAQARSRFHPPRLKSSLGLLHSSSVDGKTIFCNSDALSKEPSTCGTIDYAIEERVNITACKQPRTVVLQKLQYSKEHTVTQNVTMFSYVLQSIHRGAHNLLMTDSGWGLSSPQARATLAPPTMVLFRGCRIYLVSNMQAKSVVVDRSTVGNTTTASRLRQFASQLLRILSMPVKHAFRSFFLGFVR